MSPSSGAKPVYGVISWDNTPVPRVMQDSFQCNGCDLWYRFSEKAQWDDNFAKCINCESMESEFLVQRSIVKNFTMGGSIDEGYVLVAWKTWLEKYYEWTGPTEFESRVLKPMELCIRDGKLTTDLSMVFPDLSMRRRLWAAIAEPFKEGRNISSIRVELGLDNRPRQYRARLQESSRYDLSVSRDQIEEAERRQSRVRVQEERVPDIRKNFVQVLDDVRAAYDAVPSSFESKPRLEEAAEKPRRKFSFDET